MINLETIIKYSTPEDNGFEAFELNLDEENVDWDQALKDLEKETSAPKQQTKSIQQEKQAQAPQKSQQPPARQTAKAPTPSPQKTATPKPVKPPVAEQTEIPRGEELKKLREELLTDLQEIMVAVNKANNELQKFQNDHPYLIAPNIYEMWKEELKETSMGLMKEFQRARESA